MQQNQESQKRRPVARILALILALIVIGGSIFALASPRPENASGTGWQQFIPRAFAQEDAWKVLKRGSSGAYVRNAQQALKKLEYYDGKVDGNFSRVFEEAVVAFQKDFGLEATGQIDEELYLLLTADLPEETPTASPSKRPTATPRATPSPRPTSAPQPFVVRGEAYSDKEHVAAYLRAYGELPPNYITKREAQALGWVNSWGNLWKVAPGMSIGGDVFGNYEGALPRKNGRRYYECDIDFSGGTRNGKRIIYSSDGLIFYTEDHYNTFEEITQ